MTIETPPDIDELPENPSRLTSEEDEFVQEMDSWLAAQPTYRLQLVAMGEYVHDTAVTIEGLASSTDQARQVAEAARNAAVTAKNDTTDLRDECQSILSSNETIAASMQSAAGYPSLVGKALWPLRVTEDEQGVDFFPDAAKFEEFTASGTWQKAPGASFVYVEALGGGGGGGNHTSSGAGVYACGGGGGEFVGRLFMADDLAGSETLIVGAGGVGGSDGSDDYGSDGGNSSFGSHLVARGGTGGAAANNLTSGQTSMPPGNQPARATFPSGGYHGGVPCNPNAGWGGTDSQSAPYCNGGDSVYGGAGGGAPVNGGTGGQSARAGNGGDGSALSGITGGDGQFPAGGGGGSRLDGGGGNGGNGVIRVWQW